MRYAGVDLMRLSRIKPLDGQWDDPFFKKTFTEREREFCLTARDPILAFAKAFAAKEAVFKALRIDNAFRFNRVEILRDETGQPTVTLYGPLRAQAEEMGICRINLSLSCDKDLVIAFAVSE